MFLMKNKAEWCVMSAELMYVQLVWEDPETGKLQQPLLTAPITIGREIDQMPEQLGGQTVSRLELTNKEISRYHALITVANQQMYITDQSTNGTFLNGQPIRAGIQSLSSKDTLRIGPYKFTATLIRESDLNATEQNRENTNLSGQSNSLQKNILMVWLIGGVVLLLMGIGAWLLVSTLLERSRPRVPVTPTSMRSEPLQNSPAALKCIPSTVQATADVLTPSQVLTHG
jgi:pSer/pThr/pTyr-binding forkhead associated (FHA) protein